MRSLQRESGRFQNWLMHSLLNCKQILRKKMKADEEGFSHHPKILFEEFNPLASNFSILKYTTHALTPLVLSLIEVICRNFPTFSPPVRFPWRRYCLLQVCLEGREEERKLHRYSDLHNNNKLQSKWLKVVADYCHLLITSVITIITVHVYWIKKWTWKNELKFWPSSL